MPAWMLAWSGLTCILGAMGLTALLLARLLQVLAGISEIEEVKPTPSDPNSSITAGPRGKPGITRSASSGGDFNPRQRAGGSPRASGLKSRATASVAAGGASVARPWRGPRRSLSLPSGGLAYGDVKISYRDGHFVTVGTGCPDETRRRMPSPCPSPQPWPSEEPADHLLQRTTSCPVGDDSELDYDTLSGEGKHKGDDFFVPLLRRKNSGEELSFDDIMRVEKHCVLDRSSDQSINDPKGLNGFHSLKPAQAVEDIANMNKEIVPSSRSSIFTSLPRRKKKRLKVPSIKEAKQWKSQQSLFSQEELERRRRADEADMRGCRCGEASPLKRNKSFTEAMGSTLMLSDLSMAEHGRDASDVWESEDSSRLSMSEGSQTNRHPKGLGFFRRMLQRGRSVSASPATTEHASKDTRSPPLSDQQGVVNESKKTSSKGILKSSKSSPGPVPMKSVVRTPEKGDRSPVKSSRQHDMTKQQSVPSHDQKQWGDILDNRGDGNSLVNKQGHDDVDNTIFIESRSRSPRSFPDRIRSPQSENDRYTHQRSDIYRRSQSCSSRESSLWSMERSSREYSSERDVSSMDVQSSDGDGTLTPRSISPCGADQLSMSDGDVTILACPSPSGEGLPHFSKGSEHCNEDNTLSAPVPRKDSIHRAREVAPSTSNDSGIQHDLHGDVSMETTQVAVRLRTTKSSTSDSEQRKSDNQVRWAKMLTQNLDPKGVRFRSRSERGHERPRPKSDIDESLPRYEGDEEEESDEENEDENAGADGLGFPWSLAGNKSSNDVSAVDSAGDGMGCLTSRSTGDIFQHSTESRLGLLEVQMREKSRDALSAQAAKLRRMSTPQPISARDAKLTASKPVALVSWMTGARSVPDNLDKLNRKRHLYSLIDAHNLTSEQSIGEESSDESECSMVYHPDHLLSAPSVHSRLSALDEILDEESMTFAEALWDHVTMDPEELGFRAGDVIRVMDVSEKHWWFGVLDGEDGWFPSSFVRVRVNQAVSESDFSSLLVEEQEATPVGQTVRGKVSNAIDTCQARANVVNEIISAEREYVKHLRNVVEGYVRQARKRPEMFPIEKVTVIFSNIEEIYEFATDLLAQLESCIRKINPHLSEIGQCFLDHVKGFEMYSEYCNNHPAACEELKELYRNKRYKHFFEACRLLQDMIEIPLEGFLLTPVQKICKYHLQLAELLKFTPVNHADRPKVEDAVEAMRKLATLINERKRKMESIEKVAAWQMLVDDWEGPDILEDSSELIYSGELNKINHAGWSQERNFFLFDHQLIYCKKDLLKKSSFCYKGRIHVDGCQIVSIPDGRDAQYNVNVRNAWKLHDPSKEKWYLLVAKTLALKQRWLKAFRDERQRVKDDMENDFNIPAHVKMSVVASLRQKTAQGKPKGKHKFVRTSSTLSLISAQRINPYATLPLKDYQRFKADSSLNKKQKTNWFFLGKGKS